MNILPSVPGRYFDGHASLSFVERPDPATMLLIQYFPAEAGGGGGYT